MFDSNYIDDLIFKTAEEDMEAFEDLYRKTGKQVFAYALSIVRSFHMAEDITQEVFIKIRYSAISYKSSNKPMAWILKITKNTALMSIRGDKREMPMDYGEDEHFFGSEEDNTEDILMLYAALDKLTEQEREIVFLKAVSGLRHKEISQLLEKPMGTVMWVYNRAIKKLEKFLQD